MSRLWNNFCSLSLSSLSIFQSSDYNVITLWLIVKWGSQVPEITVNLRANILTTMFAFQTPARLLYLLHFIYSFENIGKKIEVHLQYSNLTVSCHVPRMGRLIGKLKKCIKIFMSQKAACWVISVLCVGGWSWELFAVVWQSLCVVCGSQQIQ